MEMTVLVKAEDRLLNVLERLVGALEGNNKQVIVENTTKVSQSTGVIAPLKQKVEPVDKPAVAEAQPQTTKHLHYGLQADGVSTYNKWDEMCKALDKAGQETATKVLAQYSENGEYGGVKPADWDKVIKACTVQDEPVKTYTIEQLRALARKVQTEKSREYLHSIFQEFHKEKISQFDVSEYSALYERLSKEVA